MGERRVVNRDLVGESENKKRIGARGKKGSKEKRKVAGIKAKSTSPLLLVDGR
jgi:hypothetical protein